MDSVMSIAKRKNIEKRQSSEQNSRTERHDQNLELGHSPAIDFSQRPYLQNLKLHTFISIKDASQENVPRYVEISSFEKKKYGKSQCPKWKHDGF